MNLVDRTIEAALHRVSGNYPVVTITGPRQSGKTTLCRKAYPGKPYANLEAPDVREFAREDPRQFLARFPEGAILDEIQRAPDLVSYLQPMVDEDQRPGRYILTGSQQFEVSNSINQSLAGRTALLKLLPFSIEEVRSGFSLPKADRLIYNGFYPRLWEKGLNPTQALGDYFETYIERDLRQLINIKDLQIFQRFIRLCAGRAARLLNMNDLANDAGVSHTTIRTWLSVLEASYVVFFLQPFHRNIGRRLVKTPKLYFFDVGLAAFLLGIENENHVSRDPLRGSLFENLVVAEAMKHRFNQGKRSNLFFYRDSKGNEVDLLLVTGPDIFPIEIKSGMTVTGDYFKGLRHFARIFGRNVRKGSGLVYGGDEEQLRSDVTVVPLSRLRSLFEAAEAD